MIFVDALGSLAVTSVIELACRSSRWWVELMMRKKCPGWTRIARSEKNATVQAEHLARVALVDAQQSACQSS
jgi:hypothetical protein